MKPKVGSCCIVLATLTGLWLTGCALPHGVGVVDDSMMGASTEDLATATARVDQTIDAANACVGNYMHRYDSPSITPGDVLDAALTECRPFFSAHRGAVHALTALQLRQDGDREVDARAEQDAEHYSNSFRRIVRETGLAVLVQRRTAISPLKRDLDEGELQL